MGGARHTADAARVALGDAVARAKRRRGEIPLRGPTALMAMQARAGNSAVSALLAARLKGPEDHVRSELDDGLCELKREEPDVDVLEKGLEAARGLGIPIDLEGTKPPASALAVTTTGFGPRRSRRRSRAAEQAGAGQEPGRGRGKGAQADWRWPCLRPTGTPDHGRHRGWWCPCSAVRRAAAPAAGQATAVEPTSDPAFAAVTKNVKAFGKAKKAHPPAASKAKEAQDAALAPSHDVAGQAKAAKAAEIYAQPAGTFDKKAFIAAVKAAIEAKSPKTLKEADDYKASGKAKEVKGDVKGLVTRARRVRPRTSRRPGTGPRTSRRRFRAGHADVHRAARVNGPDPVRGLRAETGATRSRSTSRPASTRPTRRWPRATWARSSWPVERAASSSRLSSTRSRRPNTPTRHRGSTASRSSRSSHRGSKRRRRRPRTGVAGMQGGKARRTGLPGRPEGEGQVEGRAEAGGGNR